MTDAQLVPAQDWQSTPSVLESRLRRTWQVVRRIVQVTLVAAMAYALLVDRWPARFEGVPVAGLFVLVSLLRVEPRNARESRAVKAESWTMVGILVAGTLRNGGWLPGLVAVALVAALVAVVTRGERLSRWLRTPVGVVLLGSALAICLPYLLSADPSWRLL
jgi:threonine/homoserine/homoserine lactone efflux protein